MSYKLLYPYIEPYAEGVSRPMMNQILTLVLREFCEKTHAWQYTCENIPLYEGIKEYPVPVPAADSAEVAWIRYASANGHTLEPKNKRQIKVDNYDALNKTAAIPTHYTLLSDNQVEVWPTPSGDANDNVLLHLDVALKPKIGSTGLPDSELISEYPDVLANGVLTRLYAMPKKAWSDPGYAALYKKMYDDQLTAAISKERDGRTRAVRRVRYGGI